MSTENKTKEAIDDLAGHGTADKIEGKLEEVKGKVKEAAGDATDNPKLQAEGEVDQAEGKAQHTVGTLEAVAFGVKDAVVEGAHKLGDAVKHMLHHDNKKED